MNFSEVRFANPEAFLLIILVFVLAVFVYKYGPRRRSRLFVPFSNWIDERPSLRWPTPFKIHYFLRVPALLFIVIALARPQLVSTKVKRNVDAVDIILSFDLSKSMDAVDFVPNRRSVAIKTLKEFIGKRSNDRIGLVLFSGEAYLAVPLTVDHKILIDTIEKSSNRLLQDGTAIGQSLAVAVHHLRNSRAKSRIIILVTDGDNNMGSVDPVTSAELAKGFGLKVYTVGIGKKGRVKFPVTRIDPLSGREYTEFQDLIDAVNEDLLKEIAKKTGGQFFRAGDAGVLEDIFQKIDELEKTEVEFETLVRYTELAWGLLSAALFLLFAEALALNTRWRKIP